MIIDGAQSGDSRPAAKLVQHAHIRSAEPMRQMAKTPPRTLFRQQSDDRIEGVGWSQERQ